jgi:malate synthase
VDAVGSLRLRAGVLDDYRDVLTPAALDTIAVLAPFDARRRALMQSRIERRTRRQRDRERIDFLPADAVIGGTTITVHDARAGRFDGAVIPDDLQRQWIQGTGPATRPRARTAESIRNVAYALLSGADGWMFDGEDALGQVESMSLDNQRNLKLAFERADVFMIAAEKVAS